jgi:hypothetical protein
MANENEMKTIGKETANQALALKADKKSTNGETREAAFVTSRNGIAAEEIQRADLQKVHQFSKAGTEGAIGAPGDFFGTGFTYRHDWGNVNGQWKLYLNWDAINANSMVFVAIGEGAPGGGKFIGDAKFSLYNVAPANGGVGIWVNIEYSYPIRLYVDYFVVNP